MLMISRRCAFSHQPRAQGDILGSGTNVPFSSYYKKSRELANTERRGLYKAPFAKHRPHRKDHRSLQLAEEAKAAVRAPDSLEIRSDFHWRPVSAEKYKAVSLAAVNRVRSLRLLSVIACNAAANFKRVSGNQSNVGSIWTGIENQGVRLIERIKSQIEAESKADDQRLFTSEGFAASGLSSSGNGLQPVGSSRVRSGNEAKAELKGFLYLLQSFAWVKYVPRKTTLDLLLSGLSPLEGLKPWMASIVMTSCSRLAYRHPSLSSAASTVSFSRMGPSMLSSQLIRILNSVACLDLTEAKGSEYFGGIQKTFIERAAAGAIGFEELSRVKPVAFFDVMDQFSKLEFLSACCAVKEKFLGRKSHARNIALICMYLKLVDVETQKLLSSDCLEFLSACLAQFPTGISKVKHRQNPPATSSLVSDTEPGLTNSVSKVLRCSASLSSRFRESYMVGPLQLDFCDPKSKTAIECCNRYQFYSFSSDLTSKARWRHELLRRAGYRLILVDEDQFERMTVEERQNWLEAMCQ